VPHPHSPAAADRVEPAAAHHRPPVPAATRAAPTDKCRRLLLRPRLPAAAYQRPPVPAAMRPAPTDKCCRLVLNSHLPAAADRLAPAAA